MGAITLRTGDGDDDLESGVFDRATARPAESEPRIPMSVSLAAPRLPSFGAHPLAGLTESPFEDEWSPSLEPPAPPEDPDALEPSSMLRVIADAEDVKSSPLSSREGFVLALLDGATSVEDLMDMAPMESAELLEILSSLRSRRLIG